MESILRAPRARGARASVWLLVAAALGGCLSGDDGDDAGAAPDLGDAPALCDATRPAVAHRAGGVLVAEAPASFVPCLSKTGVNSREPTLGIGATGTLFHYPAMTGGNYDPSGVSISRDAGATWEVSLPNVGGVPTHPITLDPYFWLDPVTGRIFADDLHGPNCSVFSWSDDEGETWDNSYSGCLETDHQTIFTGPPVTSPMVDYPNVVYRCAISGGALAGLSTMSTCQRSLDGGRTWLAPGGPAFVAPPEGTTIYDGALGHGATDANGRVYLPKGLIAQPWLAWSDDEGVTWESLQIADNGMGAEDDGYPGHEAGIGIDAGGNLYYLWVAEDRLPYLSISRDRAATWSEPLMVGAPGVNEASLPEIIAGGEGEIAFVYMGSINSPGAPFDGDYDDTTWNGYLAVSIDALADDPVFLTASVNDPATDAFTVGTCGAIRCQSVQDFLDVRIGPDGVAYGAFIDACIGSGLDCAENADNAGGWEREGAVGWLVGGPSLWDESDENGPYPS